MRVQEVTPPKVTPPESEGELLEGMDLGEEARIQQEARDRAGIAAAERGDVEAFEQPDLFAAEQEQEKRRLGPAELRRPDQFMDVPEDRNQNPPNQKKSS